MARKRGKILIVDDNEGILKSLRFLLKYEFEEIFTIKSPNQLSHFLQKQNIDVVLLDMNFSAGINTGNEGIYWLREIIKKNTGAMVILITAYGDVELAVKGIKEGASDFILKPWNDDKLIKIIHNALKIKEQKDKTNKLEVRASMQTRKENKQYSTIIGKSDEIKYVLNLVSKIASTDANVLILGENGTGKELIAHEIHRQSARRKNTFLEVDIASFSDNLIESELFGHVKGAYTHAHDDRKGRFELASGGTLFLDEIGNLNARAQTKLLSALQNRKVSPIGSSTEIEIDIRLICATNRSLHESVAKNNFREDLLFRINTIEILVPPLRERRDDIVLLAEYFLKTYGEKYNKPFKDITDEGKSHLLRYAWPGNVRELQHCMEKAVILGENERYSPEDFVFSNTTQSYFETEDSYNLEDMEKKTIRRALKKNNRNLSNTARELGITRKTLYSKIEKYDL